MVNHGGDDELNYCSLIAFDVRSAFFSYNRNRIAIECIQTKPKPFIMYSLYYAEACN